MRQWERDDTWQKAIRDRFLAPFYKRISFDGRFAFIQKSDCSTLIQKRYSVDTALQTASNRSDFIEEKIIRQLWDRFFFETDSCTLPDKHSDGWMCYTQADTFLYAFFCHTFLDTYIIEDFQEVKMWFWQVYRTYHEHTMPTDNRTRGRLVLITDVAEVVKVTRYHIFDNGLYKPMPLPVRGDSKPVSKNYNPRVPLLTVEQVREAWENVAKRAKQKLPSAMAVMLRLCKVLDVEDDIEHPIVIVQPAKQGYFSYIEANLEGLKWALRMEFGYDCDVRLIPPVKAIQS